ncbi:MAG TPA: GNAT family N-acetyltransferase [Phycisphaerales bacterium]|nr:GNAT family N-acetyltransferase [Phycisphaerales bacterium]
MTTPAHFDKHLAAKVKVRPLEPEDSLAHLTYLLHRAYKQHADRGIKSLAAFQPEEVTRKRIAGGECFVALYMGKIVGTILFKDAARTALDGVGGSTSIPWFQRGDVASFSQFAVEPEHQGHGIGGVLMQTVERRAAATGAAEIGLSTPEPAAWLVEMYLRHGYRVVEHVRWKETNYVSAIMSKALRSPAIVGAPGLNGQSIPAK